MVVLKNLLKCGKCGEVAVFEITPPSPGSQKSFQFICPSCGQDMRTGDGKFVDVNLKDYDESKLKHVRF